MTQLSYPRQSARTQRFTLGRPRGVRVSPDGARVVFTRSRGGTDPVNCLWTRDVATGAERLVADPRVLLGSGEESLPAEERARRERLREGAGGIVAYATDDACRTAAFALSGRLFHADLGSGEVRELPAAGPVIDPRPDPTGRRVAYVTGGELHLLEVAGSGEDRALAAEEGISWGLAEFVAAEEMDRIRGYWWAPDGERLLAARVDEAPVRRWHIADPANPDRPAREVAYPQAGSPNARVTLHLLGVDGSWADVRWDREEFPYVVTASWSGGEDPLITVMARDQRGAQVLAVGPRDGGTRCVRNQTDPVWVEVVPGLPAWLPGGHLLWAVDDLPADTRRLVVDGEPVTPPGLQVRAVLDTGADGVLFTASAEDPAQVQVYRLRRGAGIEQVTQEPGVHAAAYGGGTLVLASAGMDHFGTTYTVRGAEIPSYADTPVIEPAVSLRWVGERRLRTAVLLPRDHRPGTRLPVLMDPYGGPHHQEVVAARNAYLEPQWFADQGFAVVVADGRGTPGRGPRWERAIRGDLAGPPLQDQVDALHAVAADNPDLDLSRVAIRGWSFGGYLAALAVLRHPDVFRAAVAGAPVTDWRLYDTFYTERYLGTDPDGADAGAYDQSSILDDAAALERDLMIIHGLADDNVVVAHTLRLSGALLAAGRPHTVLPLSGITHMTPQEVVAENLLLLQVDFLRRALG